MLNGEFGEGVGTLQIEFGTNVSSVIINRARADAEFGGYLFRSFQLRKRQEHESFGGSQIGDARKAFSLNHTAAAI